MIKRCPLNRDGTFIENFTTDNNLWMTLLALHFANKHLFGMIRDDKSDEITHCTRVCCDLIDRNIHLFLPHAVVDVLLAIALLHDVVENTLKTANPVTVAMIEAEFGAEIAHNVDLITKRPEHKGAIEKYFERVGESPLCVIVKAVDKENVAGTMIKVAKTIDRLKRQADETEAYLLPLMKKVRKEHEEFRGILISARNHLKSILIGMRAHIRVLEEQEALKKKCERLEKKLGVKKDKAKGGRN